MFPNLSHSLGVMQLWKADQKMVWYVEMAKFPLASSRHILAGASFAFSVLPCANIKSGRNGFCLFFYIFAYSLYPIPRLNLLLIFNEASVNLYKGTPSII